MKKKILILVPTRPETEPFGTRKPVEAEIVITGIGPYKCAVATMSAIFGQAPRLAVLAGIAGAYPDSGLSVGDAVIVGTEYSADMGAFTGGTFVPKFRERYTCPHIPPGLPLRTVRSNSVSGSAAPYTGRQDVEIENMEGAAFFYTCLRHRIPFLEIRAVSNFVGDDFTRWDIPKATEALGEALNRIIRIFAAQ